MGLWHTLIREKVPKGHLLLLLLGRWMAIVSIPGGSLDWLMPDEGGLLYP